MKIAILSDIHGNYAALKNVLKEAKNLNVDKYLFLGDYLGYYYEIESILKTIRSLDYEMIKGNHELLLKDIISDKKNIKKITKKYGSGMEYASKQLNNDEINYLIDLPSRKEIILDETKILMAHGSPWNIRNYIYPDSSLKDKQRCLNENFDFVFIGHSHYSFVYEYNDKVLINVGSIGQNRREGGIATWCFLNTNNNYYEIKKTKYDINKLMNQIERNDPNNKYLKNVLLRN